MVFVLIAPGNGILLGQETDSLLRKLLGGEKGAAVSGREIEKMCMNGVNRALPVLKELVTQPDPFRADFASTCLLSIDDPEAIDILRKAYAGRRSDNSKMDMYLKDVLCLAMSTTKSQHDVDFLISQVDGPRTGLDRMVREAACFSLAALKAERARPALENRLIKLEYGLPMENWDIRFALDRINGKIMQTPQCGAGTEKDAVICAVLRFDIPTADSRGTYVDKKAGKVWHRKPNAWTYEKNASVKEEYPIISFDVFVADDGRYAMCWVLMGDIPHGLREYTFLLRKEGSEWTVVRLSQSLVV